MKKLIIILSLTILFIVGMYFYLEKEAENDSEIVLYGNVDIRDVNLGFRVFGRVEKMHFEEGDRVKKGEILAEIDRTPYEDEVNAAKADIELKKSIYENSLLIFERKKELLKTKYASQQAYDDALSARDQALSGLSVAKARLAEAETQFKDTELHSPNEGVILTRIREPGSIVSPGDNVYTLALDTPIWVRAYINEENLGNIHPGIEAEIYTSNHADKPYKGQVGFISPVAEFTPKTVETEELRTKLVYRLRVIINESDRFLRQGMPVKVIIRKTMNEK